MLQDLSGRELDAAINISQNLRRKMDIHVSAQESCCCAFLTRVKDLERSQLILLQFHYAEWDMYGLPVVHNEFFCFPFVEDHISGCGLLIRNFKIHLPRKVLMPKSPRLMVQCAANHCCPISLSECHL